MVLREDRDEGAAERAAGDQVVHQVRERERRAVRVRHYPGAEEAGQVRVGRRVVGHEWQPGAGFAYGELFPDETSLTNRYVEITREVGRFVQTRGLSGSIYTEPYDLENEINGFYTYDRQVLKMTESRVRQVNL